MGTNAPQLTSDLATEADAERIVALDNAAFGQSDLLSSIEDYRWRHFENPAGKALIPVLRNRRGIVVGFFCLNPIRVHYRGEELTAAASSNLVIVHRHRHASAFPQLISHSAAIVEQNGIALCYSFVVEEIFNRIREQKPEAVTTLPLLVKVLNPLLLAEALPHPRAAKGLFQTTSRLARRLHSRFRRAIPPSEIRVRRLGSFDDRFDHFWRRTADHYPLSAVRDRAFLSWRFANRGGRNYDILVANPGGGSNWAISCSDE